MGPNRGRQERERAAARAAAAAKRAEAERKATKLVDTVDTNLAQIRARCAPDKATPVLGGPL
jgi:hypothetical protein